MLSNLKKVLSYSFDCWFSAPEAGKDLLVYIYLVVIEVLSLEKTSQEGLNGNKISSFYNARPKQGTVQVKASSAVQFARQ